MKFRFVFVTLLLLHSSLAVFTSQNVEARSFLWKVQSEKSVVYLFGSIHFAKPEFYPLRPEVEKAFKNASILAVEVNINNISEIEMQQTILAKGIYPPGDSLQKHVDQETLSLLDTFVRKQGLPPEGFLNTRPGFLAMTLSIMKMVSMGFLPEYGLDLHFIRRAEKYPEMSIVELESSQEQLELFFNLPNQEAFLKYTLIQFAQMDSQIKQIVSAWQNGDAKTLAAMLVEQPEKEYPQLAQIQDLMFTQRNKKMAQKIETFLQRSNTYFVVVGAGHLVGKDGIVALLQKKGYSVQQQ
ncbi:MAG: TraB/GumN family protein [Gammaproteobacteria bacterium]|nr:TraB/GumN family protein [Gammaproteobacteria bacterium]MDH5801399.1 TraB/GumN family protein [Gammaproteobacteria bacterium]